ncbi:hypothetical protein [Nodosilinea nodulosa]|uniref:hypothetical protein n=1 Tax=Nodosilinea nodulosa TaxID=416001 RepID=UPI0002EF4230|nr:hypothetical protein [Nodosilinea nodulosa]
MLSTLTIVGFIFSLAWVQQIFLNRIIASDQAYLKELAAKQHEARIQALLHRSPS